MSGDSFTEGVEPAPLSGDRVQPSAKALPEESIRTGSIDAPPVAAGRSFFSIAGALLRSTRPQQWVKNALVFAGVIFSQQFTDLNAVQSSVIAFGLFVLASGGIYLVNDMLDVDADRAHPLKRERPLAADELPLWLALIAAAVLLGSALIGAFLMQLALGAIVALYVGVNLAYSAWLKHVVLLDVLLIASGFLLRAAAGAVAVLTPISLWLYLCTLLLALLIILGKRRSEIGTARSRRRRPPPQPGALRRPVARPLAPVGSRNHSCRLRALYALFARYVRQPDTYRHRAVRCSRPGAVFARHTHALWRGEPRSAALPRPVAARQRGALGPNCAGVAVCGRCSSNVAAERECIFCDVDNEQLTENPMSAARGTPACLI